jgi:hypothetical protein
MTIPSGRGARALCATHEVFIIAAGSRAGFHAQASHDYRVKEISISLDASALPGC